MECSVPTVFLVEDDLAMSDSLAWTLDMAGLAAMVFGSSHEALAVVQPGWPGCFVLDFQLPRRNGLELLQELRKRKCRQSFLMISAYATVNLTVDAMRCGAVDVLEKPFSASDFLRSVRIALKNDSEDRCQQEDKMRFRSLLDSLTPREKQVMTMVTRGQLTKQIAAELEISTKTVDVHRSNITRKFCVRSVAQLVRLVARMESSLTDDSTGRTT